MRVLLSISLCLLVALAPAAAAPLLTLTGPEKNLTLSAGEFTALPRTKLTASDPHTKAERRFAGVLLRELLARIDAPFGKKLRGPALQLAVLVRATDGYAVVFSLSDLDEGFGNRTVLLADQENGAPLTEKTGPLRLVVPGDSFAARWVRNVNAIELVTVGPVAPRHP